MNLENMICGTQTMQMQKNRTYNLEALSATEMYMEGGGPLKIIDLKNSAVQIHIHEGDGGTAHYKQVGPNAPSGRDAYINMNSYDAAMGDYYAQQAKIERLNRNPNCSRS